MTKKLRPIERLTEDDRLLVRDLVLDFITYARRQRQLQAKKKQIDKCSLTQFTKVEA